MNLPPLLVPTVWTMTWNWARTRTKRRRPPMSTIEWTSASGAADLCSSDAACADSGSVEPDHCLLHCPAAAIYCATQRTGQRRYSSPGASDDGPAYCDALSTADASRCCSSADDVCYLCPTTMNPVVAGAVTVAAAAVVRLVSATWNTDSVAVRSAAVAGHCIATG